jgi:hypothetical protein
VADVWAGFTIGPALLLLLVGTSDDKHMGRVWLVDTRVECWIGALVRKLFYDDTSIEDIQCQMAWEDDRGVGKDLEGCAFAWLLHRHLPRKTEHNEE